MQNQPFHYPIIRHVLKKKKLFISAKTQEKEKAIIPCPLLKNLTALQD